MLKINFLFCSFGIGIKSIANNDISVKKENEQKERERRANDNVDQFHILNYATHFPET